jgi:hypothetical protein
MRPPVIWPFIVTFAVAFGYGSFRLFFADRVRRYWAKLLNEPSYNFVIRIQGLILMAVTATVAWFFVTLPHH